VRSAVDGLSGINVEFREILIASPMRQLPGSERLVSALQAAARETMEREISAEGVPLYTDARLYCEAGVPTVIYGAGPRTLLDANGHRADEKVVIEDLRLATKTVALALSDLLKQPQ
jgi:acetylornithine deacetylase/succinyl-diaminopimelate desuccinylase-like protein